MFIHKYLLVKHANVQTSNRMRSFSKQEYSLTFVILKAFYASCSDEFVFFSALKCQREKDWVSANSRNLIKPITMRKSMPKTKAFAAYLAICASKNL